MSFYRYSKDVTPAGTDVDLLDPLVVKFPIKAIRIGTAGDLKVQLSGDFNLVPTVGPIILKVVAGELLEIRARTIIKVGTTAGNIVALG